MLWRADLVVEVEDAGAAHHEAEGEVRHGAVVARGGVGGARGDELGEEEAEAHGAGDEGGEALLAQRAEEGDYQAVPVSDPPDQKVTEQCGAQHLEFVPVAPDARGVEETVQENGCPGNAHGHGRSNGLPPIAVE